MPPWVGYLLAFVLFLGISTTLFQQTVFATYLYILVAVFYLHTLLDTRRNRWLRQLFLRRQYLALRLLENGLLSLPFLAFLLYQKAYLGAGILIGLAVGMVIIPQSLFRSYVLPTPFGKKPFEFVRGFRATWLVYTLVLFLLYQAVAVGNAELGLFVVLLVFLIAMSYYQPPEQIYWVWIYRMGPAAFLRHKLYTGLQQVSLLALVPVLVILFAFPGYWAWLLLVLGSGYLYLTLIIISKYAAFPAAIPVPQAILIMLCVWFPPALLVILPFFYRKARRALKPILV